MSKTFQRPEYITRREEAKVIKNSFEKKRALRESTTIILLALAFIASAVADGIFYKTMEDAKKNFITDQRPLIWKAEGKAFDHAGLSPQMLPDGRLVWNFININFGKSTAHKVRYVVKMRIGIKESEVANTLKEEGLPIVPQGQLLITSVWPVHVTKEEYEDLKARDFQMWMHIVIKYEDAVGNGYETSVCEAMLANGTIAYCNSNYVK